MPWQQARPAGGSNGGDWLKPGKATGQQLVSRVCQQVVFSDSSGAGSPGPGLLPLHAILSLWLVILAVMEDFLTLR